MKRRILKGLGVSLLVLVVGVIAVIVWLRTGDEKPLDYSALSFSYGPQNSEINGYTYLREYFLAHEDKIPDDYPFKVSEDYEEVTDYDLYENWELPLFKEILEANRDYLEGVEAAFDCPHFLYDQPFSKETMQVAGDFRGYMHLRFLEARVLYLEGDSETALIRLIDFAEELEIWTQSGGGLVGLLTGSAIQSLLTEEINELQAHGTYSSDLLRELAAGFDHGEDYSEAIDLVMRQEFHFVRAVLEDLIEYLANVESFIVPSLWTRVETPSDAYLFSQKLQAYLGMRKVRTVNKLFHVYAEAAHQAHLPSKQRDYTHAESLRSNTDWTSYVHRNPYGLYVVRSFFPHIIKMMGILDGNQALACAAKLSLSLHAYYLEHQALPESLNALVPEYLPAIPLDPFDGQHMRYSKEKRIIYSVGNDYVDEGGSELPFVFQLQEDDNGFAAENDRSEPTFPLRFAM